MELRKSFLLKYLDFYNKCKQDYNINCNLEIKFDGDEPSLSISLAGAKNCIYFNKDFDFYLKIFLEDLEVYFWVYYEYTNILDSDDLSLIDIILYEKKVY